MKKDPIPFHFFPIIIVCKNYSQFLGHAKTVCMYAQSCPTLCNPMDCSHQSPLSMRLSQQEYWSGLSFPPPGDLPNPGIKPESPVASALQADSLPLSHLGSPRRQTKCELQLSLSNSFASAGVHTHTHTHTHTQQVILTITLKSSSIIIPNQKTRKLCYKDIKQFVQCYSK